MGVRVNWHSYSDTYIKHPDIGLPVLVETTDGSRYVAWFNGASWEMRLPDYHGMEVNGIVRWTHLPQRPTGPRPSTASTS